MTYNKDKALQILDNLKNENKYDENFCLAAEDLRNALSLGLICYTQHLAHWSDIPEHTDSDTKAYWIALHNIHKTLVEAGIFDGLE